jgi:hypothetical protein
MPSTKSAEPEIGGVTPSTTHPVTAKVSWQLGPGILNCSAESINGMNAATGNLGPLEQASCFPASDFFSPLSGRVGIVKNRAPGLMRSIIQAITTHFGTWGLAGKGDPMDGTQYPSRSLSRMSGFKAWRAWPGSALCRGVPGNRVWYFRPLEFFSGSVPIRVVRQT